MARTDHFDIHNLWFCAVPLGSLRRAVGGRGAPRSCGSLWSPFAPFGCVCPPSYPQLPEVATVSGISDLGGSFEPGDSRRYATATQRVTSRRRGCGRGPCGNKSSGFAMVSRMSGLKQLGRPGISRRHMTAVQRVSAGCPRLPKASFRGQRPRRPSLLSDGVAFWELPSMNRPTWGNPNYSGAGVDAMYP
jgi:hypothetical protein